MADWSVRVAGRHVAQTMTALAPFRKVARKASLSGALPRSIWQRLPVEGAFDVQTRSGSFRYESAPGDLCGRPLFWRGVRGWEAETLSVFERLASAGGTIVDVGANTGVYSLLACAASPSSRVVALEPVPRVFDQLERNIALNGWAPRCRLLQAAASSAAGSAEFVLPSNAIPTSAHLATAAYRSHEGERVQVEAVILDDVLAGYDVRLVKIDVEGAEDSVLLGMCRTLARCRPVLVVECLPEGPYRMIQSILEPQGYDFFRLTSSGRVKYENICPDPARRDRNFLCTPSA